MSLGILSTAGAVPTFDASHSPMFQRSPSISRSAHISIVEAALADKVVVQIVHDFGKHVGRVEVLRRRGVLVREQKHFVHADVERLGVEGVDQSRR